MAEYQTQNVRDLVERLARIEHERWSHWQRYMHDQAKRMPDGSLFIPTELVDRWERQIRTAYDDLSPEEKESDREQVRRYLPEVLTFAQAEASMPKDDTHPLRPIAGSQD